MNQVVWYEQVWWQGFKEILSLFGFVTGIVALLYTARTYRRNTETRMQDTDANKVKRTYDAMVVYPEKIREQVIDVTKALVVGRKAIEKRRQEGASEAEIEVYMYDLLIAANAVSLLHSMDAYGFLLSHHDYLYTDEVMNTFASEVNRILLAEETKGGIDMILSTSSMTGIGQLRIELRMHQSNQE